MFKRTYHTYNLTVCLAIKINIELRISINSSSSADRREGTSNLDTISEYNNKDNSDSGKNGNKKHDRKWKANKEIAGSYTRT